MNMHSLAVQRGTLLLPILIGGGAAGVLDLIAAMVAKGFNVPRVIAGGLLGPRAIQSSSASVWILGVVLHFFIAFAAATVYSLASQKLVFLNEYFLVCGLFFGIAIFLVMYLVVMPLSALHFKGPFTLATLLQAIAIHMLLIGLPISAARARFG